SLGDEAPKRFDLRRDRRGRVHVEPEVAIDGRRADSFSLIGSHGFAAVHGDLSSPGAALELSLAPVGRSIAPHEIDLMRRREPLVVDASDEAEFTDEFFPVLRSIAPVTSNDATVDLPEAQPPRLSLLVIFGADDDAELHWSWRYSGPRRELPILPGCGDGRDDGRGPGAGPGTGRDLGAGPGAGRGLGPGAGQIGDAGLE